MANNKESDFNLNISNISNMSNYPSGSLLNESNNSNLSDLDTDSIKDSSNINKFNDELKNGLIDENNTDNYIESDNSIHLNDNNTSSISDSLTCEELHKDKVNIGDTELIKLKKKHALLIVISIVIGIVALLLVGFFVLIDNTKLLDSHFDNIDELRNTYSNTGCEFGTQGCDDDKTLQTNAISSLFNDMVINNDGTATINVPKSFVYTFVTLEKLNDLDFIKNNDIVINQFGYDLSDDEYINIYGDITYKGIKAGVIGKLSYSFKDDYLIIKFIDAKIGNIPSLIYKNLLPDENEIIYQKDISYSLTLDNDINIKIFSPSEINRITYDEKTGIISIFFNYKDSLSNISNELFSTENGESNISKILDYYLGINSDKLDEYIDEAQDYLKDNLGIDLDDINDLIKMFSN